MDCPIVAALTELAGAVQRVDDPYPVGLQPDQVVVGFLAQHRIVGPLGPQPTQDEFVGQAVPGVAEGPGMTEAELLAHLQQQLPRVGSKIGSQGRVRHLIRGGAHRFSITDDTGRPRTPATEWDGAGSVRA